MSLLIDWLDSIHQRREKLDAIDELVGHRFNDPFVELVRKRLYRMSEDVFCKDPNAALWLMTAEERRAHPLLYARHRVIEFLQRFRR